MKPIAQCNEELGQENERLAPHWQARTRPTGVPCSRGYPCGGEEAKTDRLRNEMAHPACLVGPSLGRLVGTRCPPDPWGHPPQERTKGEIRQLKKSQAFVRLWLVLKEMSFPSLGTNKLQWEWQWWIARQPAGHVAHSKQLDERQTEGTWQILQEIQSRIYNILSGSGIQSCLSKVLGFPSHQQRMASIRPKASHPAQTCNSDRQDEGSKVSLHAEVKST